MVICGNVGEFVVIVGEVWEVKGVDVGVGLVDVLSIVEKVVNEWSMVVIISGEVDVILDGMCFVKVVNGSVLFLRIIGFGCLFSVVCGSFMVV